jgi:antitoxin HigA-1
MGLYMAKLANIHPGEVLLEEFLRPLNISQNALARDIGVPPRRINEIIHGKRSVSADTDLRLARAFGTSEGFWLGLQADYDLEERRRAISSVLKKIRKLDALCYTERKQDSRFSANRPEQFGNSARRPGESARSVHRST